MTLCKKVVGDGKDTALDVRFFNDGDHFRAIKDADIVLFAVDHPEYKKLNFNDIAKIRQDNPVVIIDAYNVISDEDIINLLSKGHKVYGYGKGHIKRLEQEAQQIKNKAVSNKDKETGKLKRWRKAA